MSLKGRTGKVVKGRIHNPHFYEWKRQRQKFATDNGIIGNAWNVSYGAINTVNRLIYQFSSILFGLVEQSDLKKANSMQSEE